MTQTLFAISLVLLATLSRLLPHAPNFTPIIAIAMFSAAYFSRKEWGLVIPFAAMLLSDFWLGFHGSTLYVYGSFLLISLLSYSLKSSRKFYMIGGLGFIHSVLFYLITNFSVWISGDLYPLTLRGLGACYAMAIQFFKNTLASTWGYSLILFALMEVLSYLPKKQISASR